MGLRGVSSAFHDDHPLDLFIGSCHQNRGNGRADERYPRSRSVFAGVLITPHPLTRGLEILKPTTNSFSTAGLPVSALSGSPS